MTLQDTLLYDCGTWDVSAKWEIPRDAVSGIYFARLVREDDASPYTWKSDAPKFKMEVEVAIVFEIFEYLPFVSL
jgi:hypothetical protein